MRNNSQASPDDIDVTSLFGALRKSGPRLLLASLAAGALTFGVLSMVAPRYQSESQLEVRAKSASNPFDDPKATTTSPQEVAVRMDKEAVNTHVQALKSPDLASKIIGDLKLNALPEFNSALGSQDTLGMLLRLVGLAGPRPGESEQDRVLGAYFQRLEVFSAKESRSIGVRFSSSDAGLAADIANKLAESYRSSLAAQTVVETDEVQKALEPQIEKLKQDVSVADAEVERFKGEKNLFKGGPQQTNNLAQQLGDLTTEYTKASAARSEVEARAKSAREMLKTGTAEVLPDVQKSPLIQNLVQQRVRVERQISELSATLLPGHPRMHQLNADLSGLKKQITGEVGKIVDSLEKEAKVAALREESVKKSIDGVKARVVDTGPDEVQLRQLEANAKSKRGELERLQAQFEKNRNAAGSRAVPIEILITTKAMASSVPVFPKKGPYAALLSVATLLLGLAWVVTRTLLVGARAQTAGNPPVRQTPALPAAPAEVPAARTALARVVPRKSTEEEASPAPMAAVKTPNAKTATSEPKPPEDRRVTINSIGSLASHIQGKAPSQGGFRTLVAGETDSIDAGLEAVELARELSGLGRQVILVDWTLEGNGLASRLNMAPTPGLSDLLVGSANFEDVVRGIPESDVHAIVSGDDLAQVESEMDPEQVNLVLDALDEAYDHIILVGRFGVARELFEAIQGRFDAGVIVADPKRRVSVIQDPPGTLLGFEVTDIAIVRYERGGSGTGASQRLMRSTGQAAGAAAREARPA